MINCDRYVRTIVNGEPAYIQAGNAINLIDRNNCVIARYVGYSSSEDMDVYRVYMTDGSSFLTSFTIVNNTFNGSVTEYAKTVIEDGSEILLNTDNNLYVNPANIGSNTLTVSGYDTVGGGAVNCFRVRTSVPGLSFITNAAGTNSIDINWC